MQVDSCLCINGGCSSSTLHLAALPGPVQLILRPYSHALPPSRHRRHLGCSSAGFLGQWQFLRSEFPLILPPHLTAISGQLIQSGQETLSGGCSTYPCDHDTSDSQFGCEGSLSGRRSSSSSLRPPGFDEGFGVRIGEIPAGVTRGS
jgi:hypothetical protein